MVARSRQASSYLILNIRVFSCNFLDFPFCPLFRLFTNNPPIFFFNALLYLRLSLFEVVRQTVPTCLIAIFFFFKRVVLKAFMLCVLQSSDKGGPPPLLAVLTPLHLNLLQWPNFCFIYLSSNSSLYSYSSSRAAKLQQIHGGIVFGLRSGPPMN